MGKKDLISVRTKTSSKKKEPIQLLGTGLFFIHINDLQVKSLNWHSAKSGCEHATRLTVYRSGFLRDILWREISRSTVFKPGTYPHKTGCQEWTTIVAPLATKQYPRTIREHCMDFVANHSPTIHRHASEPSHTCFSAILTRSKAFKSMLFTLLRFTWNNGLVQKFSPLKFDSASKARRCTCFRNKW